MPQVNVSRTIQAPTDLVFSAISEIEHLPDTVPDIVKVEFLSDSRTGVGTRFVETRLMNGKEAKTELEITECVQNQHARMVAENHGTVWDTTFTVKPNGDGTELHISMDARAQKFLPKIMTFLFQGLFKKGLAKHVESVKAYCEERAKSDST